jgi:hypothetical protein
MNIPYNHGAGKEKIVIIIGIHIDNFKPGAEIGDNRPYTKIREVALLAEEGGFDSI